MGKQKPGYQLPDAVPTELACIKVYVPDCPEALLALKGSFDYLCKWVAWEKPGDSRPVQMAQAFRAADVLSWLPCVEEVDMCTCDEIRTIVREELENMTINIYNGGCGCGCSGGGGGGIPEPPPESVPLPTPSPSEPLPNTEEYLDYNCRLANYIVDSLIDVAVRFKNLWIGGTITIEGIITVITAVPVLQPYYVFVTQVLGYIAAISSSGVFDQLIELFTLHRDELVCVLHEAESPASAEENLQNTIMGYTTYPYATRIIAWVITEFIPFSTVFIEDAVDIPATYDSATCCDEPEPDPTPSGLYFLVSDPGDAADASIDYGITGVFGDGIAVTYYQYYACKGVLGSLGEHRVNFAFVDSLGAPATARIQVVQSYNWTGSAGGDYAVASFNEIGTTSLLSDLPPALPYNVITPNHRFWLTGLGTDVPPVPKFLFRVIP